MLQPYAPVPRPYAPPPVRAYDVAPPPPPLDPKPVPGTYPAPPSKFGENLSGSALHTVIGAAVGGAVGFAIGRGKGAAWGASIGAGLAQGFMQMLTRIADGGDPKVAAIPGAAALAGGVIGAMAGGAGAVAVGVIAGPAAILGVYYGARWLVNRIGPNG